MRRRAFYAAIAILATHVSVLVPARSPQPQSGSIEGRVTFVGTPPPPTMLTQDGDAQPVLYLDPSGGLRYAVVYLPDAPATSAPLPPPVTLSQRRFMFEPQVLAVRARQTVRFTNDDPANHNVRARDADPANTFNVNTSSVTAAPFVHRFAPTPAGHAIELSCDIHPWMAAWVYVFEHDRFAVTAGDGTFRIQGVPSGRYRIAVRQPAGGLSRDVSIDVRSGETSRLEVRFTPADLRMSGR